MATTTALTVVEDEIPDVSNSGQKTDYNTKISKIENKIKTDDDHDKYITTQDFLKLEAEHFTARLVQANLVCKSDIANFVRETDCDKNDISNKTELIELSKKVEAISKKGLTKDLLNKVSVLRGAEYFSSGIFQNYLLPIPAKKLH